MARTFPTNNSPIDAYASWSTDRPLGYFEWAMPAAKTSASQVVYIKAVDAGITTSGYNRGLYISYNNTGAKTGTSEINCLAIDGDASGNVPLYFLQSLYLGALTGATVNHAAGIYMYLDSTSGTLTQKHGIWIQMVATGATYADFLSVHNMGGTPRSVINSQSVGVAATYFFRMGADTISGGAASAPVEKGDITSGKTCVGGLRCQFASTVAVIPLYED